MVHTMMIAFRADVLRPDPAFDELAEAVLVGVAVEVRDDDDDKLAEVAASVVEIGAKVDVESVDEGVVDGASSLAND